MVSDSPYRTSELLLPPLAGAAAGLVAAVPMLAVVSAVAADSGAMAKMWLGWLAGVAPYRPGESSPPLAAGLVVHVLIGAVLGILYAMSQQRVPPRVLAGIGLFYGLMLWIAGRLLLGWVLSTPVRDVVHTWSWLAGALTFGLALALAAAWAGARRPAAVATPRD